MTYVDKLLDKVLGDDDVDLILGEMSSKPKAATRTVSSTARDNFIDVCLFFKKHGRLPQNSEENLVEHAVWSKMQGIINKPALIAQVRDLDDCGILDLAGASILLTRSSSVGSQSVEKDVHSDVTSNISPMCQLAKAIQSSLAAVTQELSRLDLSLSELITEQTFDDDAHKNINEQVLALSLRLKEVAGITRASTQTPNADQVINHGGPDVELDPTPIQSQSTEKEDIFSESFAEPGTAKEPCSIDDVFADDELDLLLGPDDVESAILSGRRATKMFDRANSEQTNREPCKEFDNYKSKFDAYRAALDDGRLVVSSKTDEVLIPGDVFLWDGLIAILTDKIGDGDAA